MESLGLKINMEALEKLAAPATAKFRQLQKIVQDIKKNDDSILNKLRRLRSKPRIPARDYREEDREEDEESDPEYDNETYETPGEEQDDSYETPPSHNHRVFPAAQPFQRGEHLYSCKTRPERSPRKPLRPTKASKQLPPTPKSNRDQDDEEDYIEPDASNDDYIEPDESPPQNPKLHAGSRAGKQLPKVPTMLTERPSSPDFYEVPDKEERSSTPPAVNRLCPVPTQQPHPSPPKPSPRLPRRSPTNIQIQEPKEDDEYEVCDANENCSDKPRESPLLLPKPLPRERSPKPPVKPKPPLKPSQREFDHRTLPETQNHPQFPPSKAFSLDLKRPKIPIPHFTSHRQTDRGQTDTIENEFTDQDKEADLRTKPWYASSCDRKTADDVLFQSNQDGAFLVRKSSGLDAQQPYTLVVFYNNRVYNIPIRFLPSSQQYALGREKKGEEFFSSVSHIIENHQRTPLVLIDSQSNTKDATRLCFPVKP